MADDAGIYSLIEIYFNLHTCYFFELAQSPLACYYIVVEQYGFFFIGQKLGDISMFSYRSFFLGYDAERALIYTTTGKKSVGFIVIRI